jgi:5-methylcytosine-specific restriction endonuclease McrA
MRASLRRKFLLAIQTDAEAVFENKVWETRCIHCRSRLQVSAEGDALGHSTLEHVIPQAWFGEIAAKALCARVGNHADDPRNLALACTRCNHDKGKSHDARGPGNKRAIEVVTTLLEKRISRWHNIGLMESPTL